MSQKQWENGYRTTMICIDSYERSVPTGQFYNQYYPEGISFHGIMDLIKKMENMVDQMNCPQPFSAMRSFAEAPSNNSNGFNNAISYQGTVATFLIKVLFRQNASWQGSVTWLEGKREECFRSVLELLYLIDSASGSKDELL